MTAGLAGRNGQWYLATARSRLSATETEADKGGPMDVAWEIMEVAVSAERLDRRREALGRLLLRALRADSFVSYRLDPSGPYSDPVDVNLGADRLRAYDAHYRYIDTLTPRMLQMGRASAVTLTSGITDEFAHDFLYSSGMHHGLNYFPAKPVVGSLDLRVWRSQSGGSFSRDDVRMLQAVGDFVHRLWADAPLASASLTPRQLEVAELVAEGLSDRAICQVLRMSLPTLRTHLTHAFAKTGAQNRAALATYVVTHRHK